MLIFELHLTLPLSFFYFGQLNTCEIISDIMYHMMMKNKNVKKAKPVIPISAQLGQLKTYGKPAPFGTYPRDGTLKYQD